MQNKTISISVAKLCDTQNIMQFIHNVWRKEHILSRDKNLFLYEFQNGDYLNIIIAKDTQNNILGIFGFMKYNSHKNPDIAGSLWKVNPDVKEPFLGLKLREYFKENIKHNFFAAPGANLQTKPIYKILKMQWRQMKHYYLANKKLNQFKIAKNPILKDIKIHKPITEIAKITTIDEIKEFDFSSNTKVVPRKDLNYIKKKFYNHPRYTYDIYFLKEEGIIKNLFICRVAKVSTSTVYRIVDFYGELDYIDDIVQFLYQLIIKYNHEYLDFITYGLNNTLLLEAGFNALDFEDENTVIPNLFEPFVQKNSPIYCVSDKTDLEFRQFKADGDQDRPNL